MREYKIIEIDKGRDIGKRFEITEPDAFTGESLFIRLIGACGNIKSTDGMIKSLMSTDDGRIIWNELINFVKIFPSENSEVSRKLIKEDIEDYQTLIKLRTESLNLILNFTQE